MQHQSSAVRAAYAQEVHHAVPRCLLRLQERANISRDDLTELVEQSTVVMDREKHRLIHETDWQRWGARGGRETVRRYGVQWMVYLALKRWGRISADDLDAARLVR